MLFSSHLIFGFICFMFAYIYDQNLDFSKPLFLLYLLVTLFFSVFPDFDSRKAKIGYKFKILKIFFKHRGMLHSIVGMIFVLFIFYIFLIFISVENKNTFIFFAFLGYISHLFADSLTKNGCAIFYPLNFKIRGFIRTGSSLEFFVVGLFFVLLIFFILFKF